MDSPQIAPLRSLDDFLLTYSRFQAPDTQNLERYTNRVASNLLYYQTNYFLSAMIIFTVVTYTHLLEVAFGFVITSLLFGISVYLKIQEDEVKQFKQQHPGVVFILIVVGSYYLVYLVGSIVVFLLAVALPTFLILLHASLRMRNIKNKIVNASEALGLRKKTPMGVILNEIGIESDIKAM